MITIAPSLLSSDFSNLKGQIALAEQGGADWLHIDVMDGHFVPNLTLGPPVIRSIRALTKLPFDTHLMIDNADRYLEAYREAGADLITVHVEACTHLHRTVARIKELGARAGVCLNPATPVTLLSDILRDVDLVLIMSVNPGFGGQAADQIARVDDEAGAVPLRARQDALEDAGVDPVIAHYGKGVGRARLNRLPRGRQHGRRHVIVHGSPDDVRDGQQRGQPPGRVHFDRIRSARRAR